jgi:parallel beta-helix repeat protein
MHSLKHLSLVAGVSLSLASFVAPLTACGATLCVQANGVDRCYTTIANAVAAAAPGDTIVVAPGTYKESVTINKPLSLTSIAATIDATGLSRGIFVNGLTAPGLAKVHIAGFTVKNANFEGILVLNASAVTISNNNVHDNNRSLVPASGTCPGMDSFEPGEQMDCGEGIHLLGADHSVVTSNTVHGNSGGILISDDTGAAHDNLISFNTVMDNPYACGIVMASHVQAAVSPSPTPLGVYHNTVYGNHSQRNGTGGTGGAGIGIFASLPGAQAYGNVVVNNHVNNNGHPGISLHAHVPGQKLTDNMLVGNTVIDNGADTGDAVTPGPTGIDLYGAGPEAGNIISANIVQQESVDVAVNTPALVQVEFNNLLGKMKGLDNIGTGSVDASLNYWGCLLGPDLSSGCARPEGVNILSDAWLPLPAPVQLNY